jgi:hypothetical protein
MLNSYQRQAKAYCTNKIKFISQIYLQGGKHRRCREGKVARNPDGIPEIKMYLKISTKLRCFTRAAHNSYQPGC